MTTKTNKFKKTVAAMMAAGALSSPATAKGITNKFRKSKQEQPIVNQRKDTVNYLSTIADKLEDNYDENKNGANLLVTQMEEFLKEIVEKEGEDTVKAAIDLLNSDYYRLSIDGYDGRSGPTWKKLYNKLYQNNLNESVNYFPY